MWTIIEGILSARRKASYEGEGARDMNISEQALERVLKHFDENNPKTSQGLGRKTSLKDNSNLLEKDNPMSTTSIMNKASTSLDPELFGKIKAALDEKTACPAVRHLVKDYSNTFGSCVPATVVYMAELWLKGNKTPFMPVVVFDSELYDPNQYDQTQFVDETLAGTQNDAPIDKARFEQQQSAKGGIEDHFVLTDGIDCVDFAPYRPMSFRFYKQNVAMEIVRDMLSEPTLDERIGTLLERTGSQYDVQTILKAFDEVLVAGEKLNLSPQATRAALSGFITNKP